MINIKNTISIIPLDIFFDAVRALDREIFSVDNNIRAGRQKLKLLSRTIDKAKRPELMPTPVIAPQRLPAKKKKKPGRKSYLPLKDRKTKKAGANTLGSITL